MKTLVIEENPPGITQAVARKAKAMAKDKGITYQKAVSKVMKNKKNKKSKNSSSYKRKSNPPSKLDGKGIFYGTLGTVVNGSSGLVAEKLGAHKLFNGILNSESLSDNGKVIAYHGSRAAANVATGVATTALSCVVAKKMKLPKKDIKKIKYGSAIGISLTTLLELVRLNKSLREDAKVQTLIAKEKQRLGLESTSTNTFLVKNKPAGVGTYLTAQEINNRLNKNRQVSCSPKRKSSTSNYLVVNGNGENMLG